jgi:hypothetical protein
MRQLCCSILLLLLAALVVCLGCSKTGEKKYVVKGTVVQGNKPLKAPADTYPLMILYPADASDQRTFPGMYDPATGAFEVLEIPAGKHRVTFTLERVGKDMLGGAFSPDRSKLFIEVTGNKDDMVIDLGK